MLSHSGRANKQTNATIKIFCSKAKSCIFKAKMSWGFCIFHSGKSWVISLL